jgi:hypothetical protein
MYVPSKFDMITDDNQIRLSQEDRFTQEFYNPEIQSKITLTIAQEKYMVLINLTPGRYLRKQKEVQDIFSQRGLVRLTIPVIQVSF